LHKLTKSINAMEFFNASTNTALLNGLRNGDYDAFNTIYKTHRRKVQGYAYRFVRNTEEAEELTQDVFVQIWESRTKIDPDKNFEAFIYTILRNNFLTALKRKSRFSLFQKAKVADEEESHTVEDYMNFKDCQVITDQAVQMLSPQVKKAYLLSRIEGCTHEEISARMGISKNTVNNHIKNSLGQIRRYLVDRSPETILPLLLLFLL
jgi:RNA polymerase sigma-70 factor (family 1)